VRRRVAGLAVVLAVLAALPSCSNAGADRILSITATGVVRGFVYFDTDGNLQPNAGDDTLQNIRVRLVARASGDTVASVLSIASGLYQISGVPAGRYLLRVDTTPLADTAIVAKIDSTEFTVLPSDTVSVNVGISYPHVSIDSARGLPPGRKVFVEGIVLNGPFLFSDTMMHVEDGTGAIRSTNRVRSTPTGPGDSVRLRGTTARRNNLPALDDITTYILAASFLPPATTVDSTKDAASASNGTLDARQIRVLGATVSDTSSITVPGFMVLTVNDGSGALEILLDGNADQAFRLPLPANSTYVPGSKFNIVGLAVPSGSPGIWRLRPRSHNELVKVN